MAATTVKGTQITNLAADPIVVNSQKLQGQEITIIRHIAAATTSIDEAADVMLLAEVPSNAIITDLHIKCDDLDSNGTPTLAADVGVFYSGIGGVQVKDGRAMGDEVDVDFFASAITTLQAATVVWTDILNEAQNIDKYNTELWSGAGLSADPGGLLIIGLKVTTAAATAVAGDIVLRVRYIA